MEFTSHLGSVHKVLQTTCSVPGIDATQQKYTHDARKPIFCRCLKNWDSAEWGHQMLTFKYFFKRRYMRKTGVHVYTVNIQKNKDYDICSLYLEAKKKKYYWMKRRIHQKRKLYNIKKYRISVTSGEGAAGNHGKEHEGTFCGMSMRWPWQVGVWVTVPS